MSKNNRSISFSNQSQWKNSSEWSFGREKRFKQKKTEVSPDFANLPSTLNKRSAGFGFGERVKKLDGIRHQTPPPTAYNVNSTNSGKSWTFGVKFQEIRKNLVPGPGEYKSPQSLGFGKPKYSFRPKITIKQKFHSPSPETYSPSYKLVHKQNYNKIGFGFGERKSIEIRDTSPGPGAYNICSSVRASVTPQRTRKKSKKIKKKRMGSTIY